MTVPDFEGDTVAVTQSGPMSATLPCMGGVDGHDSCPLPKKCMYRRRIDAGFHEPSWVAERGKCVELVARADGFKHVVVNNE